MSIKKVKVLKKEDEDALRERGYGNEYGPDDKVLFKLYNPGGRGAWYVMEGEETQGVDGRSDWRLSGLCGPLIWTWGSFSLNDLIDQKLPFGLMVEPARISGFPVKYGHLMDVAGQHGAPGPSSLRRCLERK